MKDKIIHFVQKLNPFTQKLLVISLALIVYGFLCRALNIYFFWESKTIGWALLLVTAITFFYFRIKAIKQQKKKATGEKMVIGILSFSLIMQLVILLTFYDTEMYKSATEFIKNNAELKNEVGEINGYFLKPNGGLKTISSSAGVKGAAKINFIIKGTKKYKDINLLVTKELDTEWITQIVKQ